MSPQILIRLAGKGAPEYKDANARTNRKNKLASYLSVGHFRHAKSGSRRVTTGGRF